MRIRTISALMVLAITSLAFSAGEVQPFSFRQPKPKRYEPTSGVLQTALQEDLADVEEVVYAVRGDGRDGHFYANFGPVISNPDNEFKYAGRGGRLCALNLRTKDVRTLLDDPEGDVRDPAVSYDGKTIIFGYRKGGTHEYHLYTIGVDGSNLTQLTDGPFNDFEPCWLPDGGIMFVSSRCKRWVPCWYSQVAVLYRCDADGSNIQQLSFGVENEITPWPLPDGRIVYTRWEYVDRGQLHYHGLWIINPDGTGVELMFDNMGTMNLYADAKPIPGTSKLVMTVQGTHGSQEHRGRLAILDPSYGTENVEAVTYLDRGIPAKTDRKKGGLWRDPYPLSENCFLAASDEILTVVNGKGEYEIVYELPTEDVNAKRYLHEPRPIKPRPVEPVIPHVTPSEDGMATFVVMDVTVGRNMKGIEKGQIKSLLVMEELPRPANNSMNPDMMSYNGKNFILHRILGEVPVEPDGSAHFKAPAGRPIFFYALDEKRLAAKAMPSFLSAMPGELVSCIGCHEDKAQAAPAKYQSMVSQAMKRPPSKLKPIDGVPEIFDYVRDIQPIWDKHCVSCHNHEKFAGNLLLVGDKTPSWTLSYFFVKKSQEAYVPTYTNVPGLIECDPGYEPDPYSTASGGSKLLKVLMDGHKNVTLSETELEKIKRWADAGTTFAGAYGAMESVRGQRLERDFISFTDKRNKEYTENCKPARKVITERCDSCHMHKPDRKNGKQGWLNRSIAETGHRFNVSHPEKSLLLLAPLSKQAGGLDICKAVEGAKATAPVFTSKDDPDYKVLQDFAKLISEQYQAPTFFEEGYVPPIWFTRQMIDFGMLPATHDYDQPYDIYKADADYFRMIYEMGPGPRPE